jgi:proton-translocating NADH-quinone oxidoreductase chain L
VNRVGDLGLALGMMLLFSQLKTLDFATAFACAPLLAGETVTLGLWEVDLLTTLCLLLFIGAVGKSAQLGLHTWLPDAMEGPTPVSALIHAATMVTAGVFLLARCSPLYEWAPQALAVVALVGACTCVFAATTGMMQNDLKRVIAYSTASQLGYMVLACGLSQYALGVFHLVNHAFFKALLFLGAGCVIHALGDAQDMRRLGGSVTLLPFTYALMGLGSLALVGVPFLTGYYSKDVILEVSHTLYTIPGRVGALFGSLVVALTTYYSLRLLLLTFLAPPRASRGTYDRAHEAGPLLALPLLPLALGSLFVGYLGREALIGVGTPFWSNALLVLPEHLRLWEAELLPQGVKFLPLGAMVVGASLAVLVQGLLSAKVLTWSLTPWGRGLYGFFNGRWFVDQVYNQYLSRPALGFGYHTSFRALDKGLLEVLGPRGVTSTATRAMQALSALQSGRLYHYALVMLLALTLGLGLSLALDLLQSLATPSMELGHPLSLTPSATLFKRLVLMALGSFLVLRQSSSSS